MYRRLMVVIGDQSWSDVPVQYTIALAAETGAKISLLMVLIPFIAGMSDAMACTLVVESIMAQSKTNCLWIMISQSVQALGEVPGPGGQNPRRPRPS